MKVKNKMIISDKEHKRRLNLYKKGLNDTELSKKLGVTYKTIRYWREKHSLKNNYKSGDSSIINRKNDIINRYYKEGMTDREIAKKIGCSKYTIRDWRRLNNKTVNRKEYERVKKTKIEILNNEILKYYKKGYNDSAIARKVGCSNGTIRKWRNKYNKTINKK